MKRYLLVTLAMSLSFATTSFAEAPTEQQIAQIKIEGQTLLAAEFAFKEKDYKEAFEIYQFLANQGQVIAEYQLGYLYENGFGIDKNPKLASTWFAKAAQEGLPEALYALATCYYYGVGVQQDIAQAVTLYHQAAMICWVIYFPLDMVFRKMR
jgi:TPR repeat protein